MVRLAVADSPALHLELVELLYKVSDAEAAATWAVRYAVPIEQLPSGLAQLVVQYGNQSPQRCAISATFFSLLCRHRTTCFFQQNRKGIVKIKTNRRCKEFLHRVESDDFIVLLSEFLRGKILEMMKTIVIYL